MSLNKIFKTDKPVIGMLHLDYLLGAKKFKGLDYVIETAKKDIDNLQKGGINGILIENWKEDTVGEFVSTETAVSFSAVVSEITKFIDVPFGINVLNNDYKVGFAVAKLSGASFVQLDVFVDQVKSNFVHSPNASKHSFEIKVNPKEVRNYAKSIGAEKVPLFVFVQPKHYILLEKGKTMEKSVKQAIKEGAQALIVTKATGTAPTLELITTAKKAAGKTPVGIGSGFSIENAKEFLTVADFAIVGTSIKKGLETDNPVDQKRVKSLMKEIANLQA